MARFIALENIGDFKKGQEVPEELAVVWRDMYKQSPVQEVAEESASHILEEFAHEEVAAVKKASKKIWGKRK